MRVDLFLRPGDGPASAALERVLAAYQGPFQVRRLGPDDAELYEQLWNASLPPESLAGGAYGYPAGYYSPPGGRAPALPAVAIYDRIAMVDAPAGAPTALRPGVWQVPFAIPELLRAAFHRALEDALAEVRSGWAAAAELHPEGLDLERGAALLEVTPAALRRALGLP